MSNHKRNVTGLKQASQKKLSEMISRVDEAINFIHDNNHALSFSSIATIAKVSKAWLYRQPELKERIRKLREVKERDGINQAPYKKDCEMLIKQLKQRNKSLSEENAILKKQVEVMYGELHNLKKYKKLQN